MKINSTLHVLVFCMAVLMFSMPFATLAQQNSDRGEAEGTAAQDAYTMSLEVKAAAERDASSNFSEPFWCIGGGGAVTGLGGLGAIIGLRIGQILDPPPQDYVISFSPGMICGFAAGNCIGLSASIYGIYNYKGAVPSERLIGKSPEYIDIYTKAYQRKIGFLRATKAGAGAAIIHLGLYVVSLF